MNHLVLSGSLGRRGADSPRAHLSLLLQGLGISEALTVGATEQEGYRLEIRRIDDLPEAKWPRGAEYLTQSGGAAPPATVAPLYAREPLDRPASRREISVPELPFVYRWERDGNPLYVSGQIDAVLLHRRRPAPVILPPR